MDWLVDAIPQQIRLGPAQLMSEFAETFDSDQAFVLCPVRYGIKPVQEGYGPVLLAIY